MRKVTIEWREGNAWKQSSAEIKCTRNSNLLCEHGGQVLVFPTLKEGAEVVCLENGKWVKVGRVTRNNVIFLGEGSSYSEMCEQLFKGKKAEKTLTVKW
jgi:hypothetical protein